MRRILGLAGILTLAIAIAPQQASAQNPLGGAILGGAAGAIIGGVAGGGSGAAIGAGIGAATGAIIAAQGEPRSGGYYYWRRGCYIRRPYGWVRVAPRYCYGPSYYYRPAPVYRQDIAETQRLLNELGYDAGPVDGQMGPATRQAIRSFQRDSGVPITGEFNFALLRRLRSTQNNDAVASPARPSPRLDCRTVTTATEGAICASPKLAALDQQLVTAYHAAMAASDMATAARLRDAQRQWLADRNSCGADTACIATAYDNRIAALTMHEPAPNASPSSPSPQPAGSSSGSQGATTVTPDASPTATQTAAVRRALAADFKEDPKLTFTVGFADLNGDDQPDMIIHYTDRGFCGSSGCLAYALLAVPGGYSQHAITLVYFGQTMTVLGSVHDGMHDLRFDDSTRVFRWNGSAYR